MKAKESLKGLVPIEVEVAFESEVKADLFMSCFGTIIGPEGTETIVSMHELIEAGYSLVWQTKTEVVLQKKGGTALPVEVHNGTPVLPNDMCLELIEEIERTKEAKVRQTKSQKDNVDLELQSIWPQLSKALKWMDENNDEKAEEILRLVIQQRRQEIQKETPKVNKADALRRTIMSLVNEE